MVGKVRLHYGMSVLPCTQLLSAETLAALTNEHLLCFNDTPDASNYSRDAPRTFEQEQNFTCRSLNTVKRSKTCFCSVSKYY